MELQHCLQAMKIHSERNFQNRRYRFQFCEAIFNHAILNKIITGQNLNRLACLFLTKYKVILKKLTFAICPITIIKVHGSCSQSCHFTFLAM